MKFKHIQKPGTVRNIHDSCTLSHIQSPWFIQIYSESLTSLTNLKHHPRVIHANFEPYLIGFRHMENLAYLGTLCLTRIQVYSQSCRYLGIFAHFYIHTYHPGITGSIKVKRHLHQVGSSFKSLFISIWNILFQK